MKFAVAAQILRAIFAIESHYSDQEGLATRAPRCAQFDDLWGVGSQLRLRKGSSGSFL